MASDDIKISVEVDTGRSTDSLDDVADSSERAGRALDDLEAKARGTDATVQVDVEVDEAKARRAQEALEDVDRAGRGVGDGVGFGTNALRDLTGPLGDAVGPAGDFGEAFEGLGDIVGGVAGKLGASEETIGKLVGTLGVVGVAVAAGVTAWNLYKSAQEKAKEEAKKLLDVQNKLADRKFEDAAQALLEQYDGMIGKLGRLGYSVTDFYDALRGNDNIVNTLTAQLAEYDRQISAIFDSNGRDSTDPRIVALYDEKQAIADIVAELTGYQTAWQTAGGDIATNKSKVAELVAAMGGVTDEAGNARDAVADIGTAFDDLVGQLEDQDAIENVRDAFDDVQDAAQNAWDTAAEGKPDADRAMRDYQQSVRDAIREVLGLGTELDNLPDETVAAIAVAVEDGDLETARALLEDLANGLDPVKVQIDTDDLTRQFRQWLATQGPGSNSLSPTAPPGTGGGSSTVGRMKDSLATVNVFFPPRVSGTEVYRAQTAYRRVNGL